jgi:transmembrane sensor
MLQEEDYLALIVKYLDDEISHEEQDALYQWLKADQQNFRQFIKLKDIWYSSEMLGINENAVKNALHRFRSKYPETERPVNRSRKFLRYFLQAAATLILVCLLSLSWNWLTNKKENIPNLKNKFTQIFIPRGQKGQITLNDGTKIWLNSNTILKYPDNCGNDQRKIMLDGEAYLDVAKDPDHPFILETSTVTLKVLGTSFNVKCYSKENTVETTLINGSLEILPGNSGIRSGKRVTLKPNEKAVFLKNNNSILIDELDNSGQKNDKLSHRMQKSPISITQVESIISWKDNHLTFRDESFEEITKKMESWYGVEIRVEDDKLNKFHFTGKFIYNETIDQVMDVISRTTPLTYTLEKNILTIRSK